MRFLVTTLIYVLLLSGVACYGAWLMDREQENQSEYEPNAVQEMCAIVASAPGYKTFLSVAKLPDDDRPPSVWRNAWFVAPLSGIVWGFALSATTHVISAFGSLLTRKKPHQNAG